MSTRELSTFPLSSLSSRHTLSLTDTYRIPFIASREFFKIAESRGAAIVHIAVTNPVVIKTTNTQPGTSPRSSRTLLKSALERSDRETSCIWSWSHNCLASTCSLTL
jgi:hypothetical protein